MSTFILGHLGFFLIVLPVLILLLPLVHYFIAGWVSKRREILSSFVDEAISHFFHTFFSGEFVGRRPNQKDLDEYYHCCFGRQNFLIPGFCLVVAALFSFTMVGESAGRWLASHKRTDLILPPLGLSAVMGAYMWVLGDLIRRTRRADLSPADLYWGCFRFVVAVPLGYAVASAFTEAVAVPVAFLFGAFPTRQILTLARRIGLDKLGVKEKDDEDSSELQSLQGIRRESAERFEDEGIRTILELAYCNPVNLTMKTGFSFSYVVDCCSQALAWLYLEQHLGSLRLLGIRGAQEICTLIGDLDGVDVKRRGLAKNVVDVAARRLDLDCQVFESTLRNIDGDPYAQFLYNVWQTGVDDGSRAEFRAAKELGVEKSKETVATGSTIVPRGESIFLHVKRILHVKNHVLRVEFADEVVKDVDLWEELQGEIFEPLRDPEFFRQARVNEETRTIEWPNGADFAPEFLYEIGKEVGRSRESLFRPNSS